MSTPWNGFHVWAVYGIDPERQEKCGIYLRDLPDWATEAEAKKRFLDYCGYPASECIRERWVVTPEGVFDYLDPIS